MPGFKCGWLKTQLCFRGVEQIFAAVQQKRDVGQLLENLDFAATATTALTLRPNGVRAIQRSACQLVSRALNAWIFSLEPGICIRYQPASGNLTNCLSPKLSKRFGSATWKTSTGMCLPAPFKANRKHRDEAWSWLPAAEFCKGILKFGVSLVLGDGVRKFSSSQVFLPAQEPLKTTARARGHCRRESNFHRKSCLNTH